jgi:hypothetical protein
MIFAEVEERERGEREKLLSPQTTGSSMIFSLYETTWHG